MRTTLTYLKPSWYHSETCFQVRWKNYISSAGTNNSILLYKPAKIFRGQVSSDYQILLHLAQQCKQIQCKF